MSKSTKIACAIVIKNKKVLIQKRLRNKNYVHEFPMGKVDQNETFTNAAIRELSEETGLTGKYISKEIIISDEGNEIGFIILSIENDDHPKSDSLRKQIYYWFGWSEIPLSDFHEADKNFILKMIEKEKIRKTNKQA